MSEDDVDLTRCLKLISTALRLSRQDVAGAVTLGGVPCTPTHADRWLRARGARKPATGQAPGATKTRSSAVEPEEFEAFCRGLAPLLDAIEAESEA
jgi:hypothetical protein